MPLKISPAVGLCATCHYVKVITSAKGSHFILCDLSKTDPRFSKYPALPVFECRGYRPAHLPQKPAYD